MKEFYVVGRWGTDYRGEPQMFTYSYNGITVIQARESAELTAEMCNEQWPADDYRSEWRLFKLVEAEK